HLAKRSSRALSFQNLEVVTVIGLALVCIALLQSLGNPLGNGSPQATVGVIADKPVVFARSADGSLGVLIYFGIVPLLQGVFLLCIHISPTYFDGIQFIRTDAPVEYLPTASFGIEQPLVAFLDQRDRQGPTVSANQNSGAASLLGIYFDLRLLLSLCRKFRRLVLVADGVFRRQEILGIRAKNSFQCRQVIGTRSLYQSIGSFLGCREAFLPRNRRSCRIGVPGLHRYDRHGRCGTS